MIILDNLVPYHYHDQQVNFLTSIARNTKVSVGRSPFFGVFRLLGRSSIMTSLHPARKNKQIVMQKIIKL
jgi:hypothetical protein